MSAVPLWYHTIELPGGVLTPGWFDLRARVDQLPWPDVRGKRCLDIATYDGFYAFELERRGAAEVVATDIQSHDDWDWPWESRVRGAAYLSSIAGTKGRGFELAATALKSRVRREFINVYDLSPERIGSFDVVVCGSLMLHLRDPVRALEAIRSVCDGYFLSAEEVALALTVAFRRRPLADMRVAQERGQWWVVNAAGHRVMVEAAGFEVLQTFGPYSERFGEGHRVRSLPTKWPSPRVMLSQAMRRALMGAQGVPHNALLAKPR